jgi:sporulation protein YlmC with PRC-barrel domain
MMEKRQKQPLTKDKIVGMQVVDADGYFVGKVKDISLCVGEMDQALVIETNDGEETIHRWSEVLGAGDLILLRPSPPEEVAAPAPAQTTYVPPAPAPISQAPAPQQPAGGRHCASCGAALDPGASFCGSCGKRVV